MSDKIYWSITGTVFVLLAVVLGVTAYKITCDPMRLCGEICGKRVAKFTARKHGFNGTPETCECLVTQDIPAQPR